MEVEVPRLLGTEIAWAFMGSKGIGYSKCITYLNENPKKTDLDNEIPF